MGKPKSTSKIEAIGILILTVLVYCLSRQFDILEFLVTWSRRHEHNELDEIIATALFLVVLLLIFSLRRWLEAIQKNQKLQQAQYEIRVLQGVLPICSYCKKIRDDEGYWEQLEHYFRSHSEVEFSHGVCPDCYEKQMREIQSQPDN